MIISNNMTNEQCLRCSHQWLSRTKDPVMCPRCKSYKWNDNPNKKGGIKKHGN